MSGTIEQIISAIFSIKVRPGISRGIVTGTDFVLVWVAAVIVGYGA